ncbi:hypothetical protein FB451DRAFT_1306035 [Mycena latifolia]|nr:hypothetical protein FB451DRAFT_1306035 [Mycena latifolia]
MSLPAELHNRIFAECSPDKELMAAWGLVSRDYLVPSRSVLFAVVPLDCRNADEFARILHTPSCDIASLIRHLSLSHQSNESPWFPDVLPRLPAFVNVSNLYLEDSEYGLRDDLCNVLHSKLPAVTTLHITDFPFIYRADAIQFACGFMQLQSLSFYPRIMDDMSVAFSAQIPSTLRALAVQCSLEEHPNWFLRHLPPTVIAMRVHQIGLQDSEIVSSTLTRLGPALASLTADFTDHVVRDVFLRDYSFEGHTGLRRLELVIGWTTPIALCLARLTSPVFEELVFHIFVQPPLGKQHRWTALDAVIAHSPARASLRRVELRVTAVNDGAVLEALIPTLMPECAGLGVLRVEVEEVGGCQM